MEQHVWLEIQNQVRHLVKSLLQPTIRRANQNRLSINTIRHINENQANQISDLQLYLQQLDKRLEILRDLDKRVTDNEVGLRTMGNRFTIDREHTQTELQGFTQRLTLMQQAYNVLDKQRQQMKYDIQVQTNSMLNMKLDFEGRLEFFKSELRTRLVNIEKHAYDHKVSIEKHQVNLIEINKFNSDIDVICKRADRLSQQCKQELDGILQSVEKMKKGSEKSVNNIRKMVIRFDATARDMQKEVIKKIEDELPVVQYLDTMDLFHMIIQDLKVKKRFADHQLKVYKGWSQEKVGKNKLRVDKAKQRVIEVIQAELPPTPVPSISSKSSSSSSYWSSEEEESFSGIKEQEEEEEQIFVKPKTQTVVQFRQEIEVRENTGVRYQKVQSVREVRQEEQKQVVLKMNQEDQRLQQEIVFQEGLQAQQTVQEEPLAEQTSTVSLLELNSSNKKVIRKKSSSSSNRKIIQRLQSAKKEQLQIAKKEYEQQKTQKEIVQDNKEVVLQTKINQSEDSEQKEITSIQKTITEVSKEQNLNQTIEKQIPQQDQNLTNPEQKKVHEEQIPIQNKVDPIIEQPIPQKQPVSIPLNTQPVQQQQKIPQLTEQTQQKKPPKPNPPLKPSTPPKTLISQNIIPIIPTKTPLYIQKSPISLQKSSAPIIKAPISPVKPSLPIPITPKIQKSTTLSSARQTPQIKSFRTQSVSQAPTTEKTQQSAHTRSQSTPRTPPSQQTSPFKAQILPSRTSTFSSHPKKDPFSTSPQKPIKHKKRRSKKRRTKKPPPVIIPQVPDLTPQFEYLNTNLQTMQNQLSSLQIQVSSANKELESLQTHNSEQFSKYESAFQHQQKNFKQFQQAFIDCRELLERISKQTMRQLAQNSQDMMGLEELVELFKLEFNSNNEFLFLKFQEFQQSTGKYCNQLQVNLEQALNECNQIVSQRRRESSDHLTMYKKILQKQGKITQKERLIDENMDKLRLSIDSLTEFCRIQVLLSAQDEIDKDGISLLGLKQKPKRGPRLNKRSSSIQPGPSKDLLSLQSKCFSCSGQSSDVMSAFKLACLAYKPSKVLYCSQNYTRKELIYLQQRMLQANSSAALTSPSMTDFRPITDLGVYSVSPLSISQTPELPPILRKQWYKQNNFQ